MTTGDRWTTRLSYLTIDVVVISKHQPSSNTGGQKGVRLQSLSLDPLLQGLQSFVCEHEARQVAGVRVRGLQNGPELILQTIREKKKKKTQSDLIHAGSIVIARCLCGARINDNSYLPFLNRNVITRACGALILAPYLRKKHTAMSLLLRDTTTGYSTGSNVLFAFRSVNKICC